MGCSRPRPIEAPAASARRPEFLNAGARYGSPPYAKAFSILESASSRRASGTVREMRMNPSPYWP